MADVFTPVIKNILDLGFGNLFIFILASAIFFAMIKKSQIFGDSAFINGAVALVAAFMVFWFPALFGANLVTPMSAFFTQATTIMLFLIIGVVMASMFYPDLPKMLVEQFSHRTTLIEMLVLGLALFITSGLLTAFLAPSSAPQKAGEARASTDVITMTVGLIIFVVILMMGSALAKGGGM